MLQLFYVFYFVVIGVSTPFFGPYLRQLGLSGQSAASVLALGPLLQIGVPLLWGWLADRTRQPSLVLRGLCLGACLASVPVIFVRTMPALLWLYFAQQIFAGSIGALADSIALESARIRRFDYTRIRLWGSFSFIATCLVVGELIDRRALKGGDPLVPLLVSAAFGLSFLASFALAGDASWEAPRLREVRQLLSAPRFRLLLIVAGLHWLGLSPFHGFFGVLLHDRGLPATTTSYAFMVGCGAEILLFASYARLRARFRLTSLLAASFAVSAVHWWIVAYTRSAFLIVATQALHALTFGMFWATSIAWIAECVPPPLRATGQVLFSTTLGLGAIVGFPLVGALYDATGGASVAFTAAGFVELLPLGLLLLYRRAHATEATL
ncbi:MAG: MFS transporter [Myxococcales bacterium]|jgi:PPP family 3-phenylpropionic acid transporter